MFEEPFARGNTFIHRLDPRVRLLAALAGAVCLAVLQGLGAALAGLGTAALLLILSRPTPGPLFRRLFAVNVFVLFLWLTVPLSMSGPPVATFGPLSISRPGVQLALLVTLKSNAILLLFLALVASMDSPAIGHALERLRFPPKLVFLFLFAYRYVHVIAAEHERLITAARLRGFTPRTNLHTYKTLASILGMVLVKSYDRSVRVYEAMRLRGFQGRFQSVARFSVTAVDAVFLTVLLFGFLLLTLSDLWPELLHV